MKKKILSSLIFTSFVMVCAATSAFLLKADKTFAPIGNVTADSLRALEYEINQTEIKAAASDTRIAPLDLKIPILMYHHLRNYDDPDDPIGTNLSVTPQKFNQQLDYLLAKGYQTVTFRNIEDGEIPSKPIILTFDDGYQNFYDNAFPILESKNMTAVVYIIANKRSGQYMTEAELVRLNDYGIEIGAHTLSHFDLTTVTTDQANLEISESKSILESITGQNIISFCYPSGKFNEQIKEYVKNAGYLYAVTTKVQIADFNKDLFALDRFRINADTNISGYIK